MYNICVMINIQIAIDCEMEDIIMIYGHILARETERAYAAPIREARSEEHTSELQSPS